MDDRRSEIKKRAYKNSNFKKKEQGKKRKRRKQNKLCAISRQQSQNVYAAVLISNTNRI